MQPDMFETPFQALTREKAALEAALKQATQDFGVFTSKLINECTHDVKESTGQYFPGTYDSKSFTETWDYCVLCKKKFNVKQTTGGSYG
jgi:hypothetical protein